MYDIVQLKSKLVGELRDIAKELDVPKYEKLKKLDLVYQILDLQAVKASENAPEEDDDGKPKRKRKRKNTC